jgi:catechol 2,3-dioxygenase-like lactoylglutathione lyase family enzyme
MTRAMTRTSYHNPAIAKAGKEVKLPPMIRGASHLTFAASDLDRSVRFYAEWLGFALRARWDEGAYLETGGLWIALILDPFAPHATNNFSYTHVAFAVDADAFAELRERLLDL